MSERLGSAAGEAIDRARKVNLSIDGRAVQAFAGDSVASAMAANDIVVTARSFKYHRPRGLFCLTGACANCLVRVDGVPNVAACQTPVEEGMSVERQNGLPSVDTDLMRVVDRFSFLFPAGFYYKSFYRPRFLWPLAEPMIRRAAGIGRPPDEAAGEKHYEAVNLYPDVLVIGGGPAGLGAAAESARAGAATLLVETEPALGGRLRVKADPRLPALVEEVKAAGVDARTQTTAFAIFEHNLVTAAAPEGLLRIRPRQIVVASGGLEQPVRMGDGDLPGIMLAGAAERLVNLYRILPGRRAVVITGDRRGYQTALTLRGAGAEVTVLDSRAHASEPEVAAATAAGAVVTLSATVIRATGSKRVRGVVARVGADRKSIACDLVVMAGQVVPASGLLAQAGAKVPYDAAFEAFVPGPLPAGLHAAGAVLGAPDPVRSEAEGRLAGLAAAESSGVAAINGRRAELERLAAAPANTSVPPAPAPEADPGGKVFTCLCMDVTTKEMKQAVEEGFDSIELLKRYTTLGMGPCQGKSCMAGCVAYAAKLTGRSAPETGVPTARAPWMPVELGLLAADHLEPRKEGALHDRHTDLGAEFLWAGEWRRPRQYRDPAEECRAVHERVALIDVSTLGKFRIKGPEAVALLERLYPNRFADLKPGRIRYGAMLNDQGVILDDGTVARLSEDEYFVTTTTSGADAIDQWIKWWMSDWRLRVNVLNVSAAYGAINVAGPQARELMSRLTDADLSGAGFPYLHLRQVEVAGVPAIVLRIGFVGELSYEVHFPSAYSEHVWDAMTEAGEDLGVLPFGLESQRILRLEKQHVIVGQDTDALSTPYAAGLGWMVKLDKEDFLGRAVLAADADRTPEEKLVGFRVASGGLPIEGAALVTGGIPAGRVCSSRWSDQAKAFIGLAWVPTVMAEEGTKLTFRSGGQMVTAHVELKPFYDPDGSRLRS